MQLQFFTLRIVAIFPYAVQAAARGGAAPGQRALEAAVGERQRLLGECGTDCAAKYPCYPGRNLRPHALSGLLAGRVCTGDSLIHSHACRGHPLESSMRIRTLLTAALLTALPLSGAVAKDAALAKAVASEQRSPNFVERDKYRHPQEVL